MPHQFSGLYAITDSQLMPDLDTLLSHVEFSLQGGASIIQYRDKSTDQLFRVEQAQALKQLCDRYQVPLVINDDIALAAECSAAGVHLGQSDGSAVEARKQLGSHAIIGVTCHDSLTLALQAQSEGADYLAFGAFFPSKTKPNAKPAAINLIRQAKKKVSLPIVAIGGITVDNAQLIISAGADMVAVIHAIYAEKDIKKSAQQFHQLFNTDSER